MQITSDIELSVAGCTTAITPNQLVQSSSENDIIGEDLTDIDLLQLPIRVLVEAADADIANALTLQDASKGESVRMKSITLGSLCQ